ncbi:MAG: germination protein YpeB [Firmicutes bacterium]|nr:germination protein YpeB [Bacillota bacterium]
MKNVRYKKSTAGIIAATLAFAVLISAFATGIFLLDRENRANRLAIENIYQQNIYQMSESVGNIEVNMSKLMISGEAAETAVLLNDTYHHAQMAITSLNILPVNQEDRAECEKFLNQLGDWCLTQSKKLLRDDSDEGGQTMVANASATFVGGEVDGDLDIDFGEENTQKDNKSSKTVEKSSEKARNDKSGEKSGNPRANGAADKGAAQSDDEKDTWQSDRKNLEDFDEQAEELYVRARRLSQRTREAAHRFKNGYKVINNLADGLMVNFDIADKTHKNDADTPKLIYDGPFSDNRSAARFKELDNKEEITAAEAIKKAEKIFEDFNLRNVYKIGETTEPAAYALYGKSDLGDMYVNISQKGGLVLLASAPCEQAHKKIRHGEDECKQQAIKYAEMCGFHKLSPVWYAESGGYAIINLTPIVNDVVIYPDLVKVKICQTTGDFNGIETRGYCTCHHKRNLTPKLSEMEAQKAVNPKLTINNRRLAVIPKDMKEVLCYEFAARFKGLDYFVYIDASTGKQADIMRVVDEEQGKLVM